MKKFACGALFAIASVSMAHAADQAPAVRWLLGVGLTGGGDKLVTVPFSDGSSSTIRAGGFVQLYGGAEFRVGERGAVQATASYHVDDTKAASNGSVRFDRFPLEVLGLYSVQDNVRLGLGARLISSADVRGTGVASSVQGRFDSTTGLVLEGEYLFSPHMGMKLRYVSEKYTVKNSSQKYDGSHVGALFTYYF
jgi:hypothetical protein